MDLSESIFWMNGRLATNCVEISDDPTSLDKDGFWVTLQSFEGKYICARFADVSESELPHKDWEKLTRQWRSSQNQSSFENNVKKIQSSIADGEIYQVNLCRVLTADCDQDLQGLASLLLSENPAPYASYLKLPGIEIASASPELFLKRNGSEIMCSPIKGTSKIAEFGDKDKAENIMIVDLMRNDFGQICESGSIDVPRLLATETHPGLFHLVSDVVGNLKSGISWKTILSSLTPIGSISGAPKSSALKTITQLEDVARGPYCGVIGWSQGDQAVMSVGIRIFWSNQDGEIHFGTGAGITWQSDPKSEWEETELKAKRLISIAGGNL
jgi:para-aminobenzoate synthetase component 1